MAQYRGGSVARYLEQLDTADRVEPEEAFTTKTNRLKEKIETLKQQMRRLERLKVEMLATPDQQISLTDPDARSMATSGQWGWHRRLQRPDRHVEANHHLIVMHEVTNDGTDRSQLSHVAKETKTALFVEGGRCRRRPRLLQQRRDLGMRGGRHHGYAAKAHDLERKEAEGRFGKLDFRYVATEDDICPAGEKLACHYTTEENGLCCAATGPISAQSCAIKSPLAPPARNDGSTRWEHEHILEAVQRRLDRASGEDAPAPRGMVEHPFGTIKARMGATHFLMKTPPRVASEMALHVLAYNLTRVMPNFIMGIRPLIAAIEGLAKPEKSLPKATRPELLRFDTSSEARFYTTKTHKRHAA